MQRAEVIARAVRGLSDVQAVAVEAVVLAAAGTQTPAELGRAVAAAIIVTDPGGAAERAYEARLSRRVTARPLPDGMGGLWAELAAEDMETVLTGLDAEATRIGAALHAENAAEVPGLLARRVDALVLWARRALADPAAGTVHRRRPHIQLTMALTTLLGADDAPAELAGYGPIDAATARRIAAQGTWRRLVTDPVSGALLDYGRTVYQPPADLREFILARDPVCTFPGCQRPARRCQLDHIVERQHGGVTAADNLHPLCLRHHLCKTVGGWAVTRTHSGWSSWTSPAGKTYLIPPTACGLRTTGHLPLEPPVDCGSPAGPDPPPRGSATS